MDKNSKTLELDKILEMLAQEASGEDAQQAALSIEPSSDIDQVRRQLKMTDDAYVLSAKFSSPTFYGMKNVINSVRRADAGAVLNIPEIMAVNSTLKCIRGVVEWHGKCEGMHTSLDYLFDTLSPIRFLEEKIDLTVRNEEEIADTASKTLADIRRKIRQAESKVREQLDKYTRSQTYQKFLQDNIVTMRDGRFVIPVKSEYRNEVQGLIHDSSASGATVFIEPMGVVEANNEIRILQGKEKDEIERILMELSADIGSFADSICGSYNSMVALDLVFAKARLAYRMKAVTPEVNNFGVIDLKGARHPLIDPAKVVETDVRLGTDFDTLVITGPNTGGKTVALKTIGLMCLMSMCGLMIPCREGSKVSVFKDILADIGDEQSIEQSLSTFSSHITNIIKIIDEASSDTLVLIDELGAGTDPEEGAALAVAIIEALRIKKVKMAATTHYSELKEYALRTDGVENGCCEFDVNTLSPTYRLLIGMPGKSNAFAISKRLGMRADIVERAKNLVSEENAQFENAVRILEESREKLESETDLAREARLSADKNRTEAEETLEKARKQAEKELEDARQKAGMIVSQTRAQAESLMEEIDDLKKIKNDILSSEKRADLKSRLHKLEDSSDPVNEKEQDDYILPRNLKAGDDVVIYDIGKNAVVLNVEGQTALVQAGIIKTRVPISNLRLISEKKKEKQKKERSVIIQSAPAEVKMDLDLRGMTSEEAVSAVDEFLDRAMRQNLKMVTIIHGKGTGVLRAAVQQHLKHHPNVKSFRLGTYGEGESGVTIAELK
jgi:DNA mismatch repair protein MutS2